MCNYKYQIAFSKMGIKPEGDLQEFYVASWGGFKPVLESKAHLKGTGTSLRGNHKQAKEGFFWLQFSNDSILETLTLSVSPPTFPICTAWARQPESRDCYLLTSFGWSSECREARECVWRGEGELLSCTGKGKVHGVILSSLRCDQGDCAMQQSISKSCFPGE